MLFFPQVFLESDKMEEKDKKSDSTPRGDTINTNLLSHHLQTRALKNLQGGEIDDKVDQEITTKGSLKENGDISATEPSEDTDNYADGNAKNGINSTAATNGVTENRTNTSIQSGRNNDEKGSKSLVPKIEIFHKSSSNSSSSSDDEKSDSENEKKKRKVRTKRKGSNSSEDSPQHMRRRIKELEQVQVEYCEARTLLDALQEAKSELARELEIEKQKNKVLLPLLSSLESYNNSNVLSMIIWYFDMIVTSVDETKLYHDQQRPCLNINRNGKILKVKRKC